MGLLNALLDGGVSVGGPCALGAPEGTREWFWYELERWPDPEVTNGPRLATPSALDAYRALLRARTGPGPRRRCVLAVAVKDRRILGATVAEPSGDVVLDDLARRLYPPPAPDDAGAEVCRVSVYGHSLPPESTFAFEP